MREKQSPQPSFGYSKKALTPSPIEIVDAGEQPLLKESPTPSRGVANRNEQIAASVSIHQRPRSILGRKTNGVQAFNIVSGSQEMPAQQIGWFNRRIPEHKPFDDRQIDTVVSQNPSCLTSGRIFVEQVVIEPLCPSHQLPCMFVLRAAASQCAFIQQRFQPKACFPM